MTPPGRTAAPVAARVTGAVEAAPRPSAPPLLLAASVLVAALFAVPFVYLVVRNVTEDANVLDILRSRSTLDPLLRTLWLATTVAVAATAIGTLLAWLTMRTDLPGRRLWRIACPLPLVLPSFVAGAALLTAFAPGGAAAELLKRVGVDSTPTIEGYWGALVVLTFITYPYAYLPVAARMSGLPGSLDEAARLLGRGPVATFRLIIWPQIRSAASAGFLLVFLYVVSDFGVVQLMSYRTLTTRIFTTRLFDQPTSFALGLVLALVALGVVVLERAAARSVPERLAEASGTPFVVRLGRWKSAALGAVAVPVVLGLVAPVGVLGWWVYRGTVSDTPGFSSLGAGVGDLGGPAINTVLASLLAAAVALVVVLPAAYLITRYRSRIAGPLHAVLVAGFALPGLVIALSAVFMALQVPGLDFIYLTLPLLIFAYVVHFGAQAYGATQVGVQAADRRLEEAARTLGAGRLRRLRRVELPALMPALAAGGGLVMLSTMKELPATLLASPIGFETLATRVWNANEDGFLADAGLAALVLVGLSAVLTWALVIRRLQPPTEL